MESLTIGHLGQICKDKDEAELWFTALRTIISQGGFPRTRIPDSKNDSIPSDTPKNYSSTISHKIFKDSHYSQPTLVPFENTPQSRLGKAFSDVLSYTAAAKAYAGAESIVKSPSFVSSGRLDDTNCRNSTVDLYRVSSSSCVSSPSQGSPYNNSDSLTDVFFWGGLSNGLLGGGFNGAGISTSTRRDALFPRVLNSSVVLDAQNVACGSQHAVLVTKQGQIFSWGEGSGGRLGHGVEDDVSYPKLIDALNGSNIHLVACGEFHTCAVTVSGELYTWGDGTHNLGLLGHVSEVSRWTPKKVSGQMEGLHVSFISCGPWHTAAVTSAGKLFTFGDGTFGALGHGDRSSTIVPREVEMLREEKTLTVSCGVWHTAAVVEVTTGTSSPNRLSSKKLFTWGNGAEGQLGHGDKEPRLVPYCVTLSEDTSFCKVACGNSVTIALTALGQVYSMGSADYGQLGIPGSIGKLPTCVEGNMRNIHIEDIACGSCHIAVLSSKAEVYTWGKGSNGQLGHGDNENRNTPTLVEALRYKQVKSVVCGSNFTAAICLHKSVFMSDHSICSGCRHPFNFRRKRYNCYNCGLVFCKACSSKNSLKAALASDTSKACRVCDDCFTKLNRALESASNSRLPKNSSGSEGADKDNNSSRSCGPFFRLSSSDSSKESKSEESKPKRNSYHCPGSVNGRFQWESATAFRPSSKISPSLPGSRMVTRPPSPMSTKSSPARSMTMTSAVTDLANPYITFDDLKQANDSPSQERAILRAMVDDLNCKSRFLELELERTSRQLKETSAMAEEEAEKNRAAQEVIRSLTTQLKDMAERTPGNSVADKKSGSHA